MAVLGFASAFLISCVAGGGNGAGGIPGGGPVGVEVGGAGAGGLGGGGSGGGATGPSDQPFSEDVNIRPRPRFVRIKVVMGRHTTAVGTNGITTGTAGMKALMSQDSMVGGTGVFDPGDPPPPPPLDTGFYVMHSMSSGKFSQIEAVFGAQFQSVPTNANDEVDIQAGNMVAPAKLESCDEYYSYWACRKIGDTYYQSQVKTFRCPQGNMEGPFGSPENPAADTTLAVVPAEGSQCPEVFSPPVLEEVGS